jgi:hypothetical protein
VIHCPSILFCCKRVDGSVGGTTGGSGSLSLHKHIIYEYLQVLGHIFIPKDSWKQPGLP